jgi:hypothetical protein
MPTTDPELKRKQWREWHNRTKEEFNAKRRERYQNDPEYREMVLERNRIAKKRRRAEARARREAR